MLACIDFWGLLKQQHSFGWEWWMHVWITRLLWAEGGAAHSSLYEQSVNKWAWLDCRMTEEMVDFLDVCFHFFDVGLLICFFYHLACISYSVTAFCRDAALFVCKRPPNPQEVTWRSEQEQCKRNVTLHGHVFTCVHSSFPRCCFRESVGAVQKHRCPLGLCHWILLLCWFKFHWLRSNR